MKKLFVSLLLAAVAVADAAEGAPFSGKWQVHTRISDRESDWTCAFVQKGMELTGDCSSQVGTGTITGKIDDKKITWTHKFNSEANGQITLKFRGAIDSAAKSITGFVNVEEYGVEGDFTATLAN